MAAECSMFATKDTSWTADKTQMRVAALCQCQPEREFGR